MSDGIKNTITSLLSQVIIIALGVIIPRLILVNLGSEANGLMSSVSSVLGYLGLLESGIGLATVQALYKPIAQKDQKSINGILSATRASFYKIGKIYMGAVFVMAIVYTLSVQTTIPRLTVFLVILLAGLPSTIYYFISSQFILYLTAEGKSFVTTTITTTFSVITSLLKILLLVWGGGVLSLQILYFVINLIQSFVIVLYMKKNYAWIHIFEKPNFDAISQRNAVLVHKVSSLIFSSTDIVLLTLFCGLSVVSVYNMYAMMFGMMKSVAVSFSDGFIYMLGQSYHDKPRFEKIFNVYEVLNMLLTFSIFCVGYIMILPFFELYTAGVKDINYIDGKVALLFVLYYLLENGRKSSITVANIAEKFEDTKWRAILETVINVSVSVACTWKYGIYGVLIGTVAGLLYRTTDSIFYAAKLMEKSPWITFSRWIRNCVLFAIVSYLVKKIYFPLNNYPIMVIYGIVLSIVVFGVFNLMNYIFEPQVYNDIVELVKHRFFKKEK